MSESKIEEWVRLEVSEGVALVTMDCRLVYALNREMRRQLVSTFNANSEPDDICCLVRRHRFSARQY